MWDDSDNDFLDGFLWGNILFDNNNSPGGCLITLAIIAIVVLVLYYT